VRDILLQMRILCHGERKAQYLLRCQSDVSGFSWRPSSNSEKEALKKYLQKFGDTYSAGYIVESVLSFCSLFCADPYSDCIASLEISAKVSVNYSRLSGEQS
jgi:hypothetical protein